MKKCFALFLVLTISLFALGGCASRDDAAANGPPDPSTSVTDPAESNEPNEEAQNQPDENEPATETPSQSGEEPEEPEEIAGIIAVVADWKTGMNFTIVSIDPDTGEQQTISYFDVLPLTEDGDFYTFDFKGPGTYALCYSSYRDIFSPDYSKVAVHKQFLRTGENHAGWLDTDGNFFDVTEALGLQAKSDFDDPAQYFPVGFTEDGLFVYTDRALTTPGEPVYYTVPVDDVRPENIQEMPATDSFVHQDPTTWRWLNNNYAPTDWISDTQLLADYETRKDFALCTVSFLVDTTTQEATEYVPGSSRHSWGGVMSPDGQNIAFMSAPIGGNEPSDLFVMGVDGGDPERVANSLPASANSHGDVQTEITTGATCVTLIDWR